MLDLWRPGCRRDADRRPDKIFWLLPATANDAAADAPPTDDDCSWVRTLVEGLPKLRRLSVNPPYGTCSCDAIVPLASHATLSELSYVYLNAAMLRTVTQCTVKPFPALWILTAAITCAALPLLVTAVPTLEDVFLLFTECDGSSGDSGGSSGSGWDYPVAALPFWLCQDALPLPLLTSVPLSLRLLAALHSLR
jgi:hypothetical protein